jgi:hypothetical protein
VKATNINSREAAKRRLFGIVMAVVAVALAVVFFVGGDDRFWRLLVLFPAWGAGLGLLQAKHHT